MHLLDTPSHHNRIGQDYELDEKVLSSANAEIARVGGHYAVQSRSRC